MIRLWMIIIDRQWDFGNYPNMIKFMLGNNRREIEHRAIQWAERNVCWASGTPEAGKYYGVKVNTVLGWITGKRHD